MSFDPDKKKQVQEVVFSRKQPKPQHSQLLFNKTPFACSSFQKHLEIIFSCLKENKLFVSPKKYDFTKIEIKNGLEVVTKAQSFTRS